MRPQVTDPPHGASPASHDLSYGLPRLPDAEAVQDVIEKLHSICIWHDDLLLSQGCLRDVWCWAQ